MNKKSSLTELDEIIKKASTLPGSTMSDLQHLQGVVQQLKGTRVLVEAIERFSCTSTILACAMIFISIVTLGVSLYQIIKVVSVSGVPG